MLHVFNVSNVLTVPKVSSSTFLFSTRTCHEQDFLLLAYPMLDQQHSNHRSGPAEPGLTCALSCLGVHCLRKRAIPLHSRCDLGLCSLHSLDILYPSSISKLLIISKGSCPGRMVTAKTTVGLNVTITFYIRKRQPEGHGMSSGCYLV